VSGRSLAYLSRVPVDKVQGLTGKRGADLRKAGAKFQAAALDLSRPEAVEGFFAEVARTLGVRALFSERENGVMRLRRGFALAPAERCLVVEDVITTGGSTREVVRCVEEAGGAVAGVGSLIDRSGGAVSFAVPFAALATVEATIWAPEACPLCRSGSQAIKPGSRT